jgi:hypothetical protein
MEEEMKSKVKLKSNGRPSKEAEERFLKAGAKIFATDFPTPEGARRFDSAALKAAAYRSHREPLPDDLVDELTWCSETFVEYGKYLREARFARRIRSVALYLVVVIGLGAALWWYLDTLG